MAPLPALIEAWNRSADLHAIAPGADPEEIDEAEQRLGRRLPPAMRSLYEAMNGGDLVEGDLTIHPLLPEPGDDDALTLVGASDFLRDAEWPIPPELVVFGSSGTGEPFGLWLPQDQSGARPFVVQVGEIFEDASFAVVGDDLLSFLTGWCAYYLLLLAEHRAGAILDVLGVPDHVRRGSDELGDDDMAALLSWASPGLPDPRPDVYERPVTADQLREWAAR